MVGVVPSVRAGDYESAQSLLVAQKWAEALPILKSLAEKEPDSITIAQDLAQVLLRLNRREESLELLRKHKLTRPADIAARSFLSKESFHFYQQGLDWLSKHSYTQACERLDRALEKDQAHIEILLRLAQCEVLDGSTDLALKFFDQLERIHGKTTESQLWRARGIALKGRGEEAISIFSSLANAGKITEPMSELHALWWGEALLASGQKSGALSVFETDVKRYPGHVRTSLAAIRLRLSQAESPNQFLALEQDLDAWDRQFALRLKEKPKKGSEAPFDPFDPEITQRAARETRLLLGANLPSPLPSSSPTPSASKR